MPVRAQTVQGVLLDEKSRHSIGSAQLALVDDSGRVASSVQSDSATGMFYLISPQKGRYRVRILLGRGGLSFSPAFQLDSEQTVESTFIAPSWPKSVLEAYLPDSVTKAAALLRGAKAPRFPDLMRESGRGGVATVGFVVTPDGRADMDSFWEIQSDDQAFTRAVRDFVGRARFSPAERDGVAVPQIYELVADFGFGTEPPRISGKNVMVIRALGIVRERPM